MREKRVTDIVPIPRHPMRIGPPVSPVLQLIPIVGDAIRQIGETVRHGRECRARIELGKEEIRREIVSIEQETEREIAALANERANRNEFFVAKSRRCEQAGDLHASVTLKYVDALIEGRVPVERLADLERLERRLAERCDRCEHELDAGLHIRKDVDP